MGARLTASYTNKSARHLLVLIGDPSRGSGPILNCGKLLRLGPVAQVLQVYQKLGELLCIECCGQSSVLLITVTLAQPCRLQNFAIAPGALVRRQLINRQRRWIIQYWQTLRIMSPTLPGRRIRQNGKKSLFADRDRITRDLFMIFIEVSAAR